MITDPKNRTISDQQMEMLSQIFRVIVKEIEFAEDKDKLAPGELGISYKTGELWIRNPHNGKLFTPNSVEKIRQIYKKFLPGTDIFNADRVRGITFYTSLIELDKLNIEYTPDTVIRQMHAPAILCAPVEYANYKLLGWPSDQGMCLILKNTEEYLVIRYYAAKTGLTYEGRYNVSKHLFEGWTLSSGYPDDHYAETEGGGNNPSITLPEGLVDLMTVVVRVTETISPGANITVNDFDPKPIIYPDGTVLDSEIAENSTIMLIYDELRNCWIILDPTESAMYTIMKLVLERVTNTSNELVEHVTNMLDSHTEQIEERIKEHETYINNKLTEFQENYERTLREFREELTTDVNKKLADMLELVLTRPGNLYPKISYFVAEHDGTEKIDVIDHYDSAFDKLIVNYNQTILRQDLDYIIVGNGIQFTSLIRLVTGDVLQFIVMKQAPANENPT